MKTNLKEKKSLKKLVFNLPMQIAKRSANTTCEWMNFEPKAPANLNKLKKENGK